MALAFAGALAVYAWGAAPTVLTGDSAEIQAVSLLGGVAHPTGYPTAILIGRLFGWLIPGDPAHRITMMSAVFGAIAVALVLRLLVELGLSLRGAFAGAMLYGFSYTFWNSALRAEVYTFSISLALFAIWRTVAALRSCRMGTALPAGLLLGLTLTGHLVFALPVAALGLALAWRLARAAPRPAVGLVALVSLAGSFLLGLTPYVYLVWADTRFHAMDYLRYVDLGFHPLGPRPAYLETPWERVWWLLTARNRLPPEPVVLGPLAFVRGLKTAALQLSLFEPGPLGVPLALVGLHRHWNRPGGLGGLFVLMCALSISFSAALSGGAWMAAVFLIPATLLICLWAAFGMDALTGWITARGRWSAAGQLALALLIAALVALPARILSLIAQDHRIAGAQASAEVDYPSRGLILSLRGYREPRRTGESVLAALPESVLVIGRWSELMTLYYLRHVEGQRPDVGYQPLIYPNMMPRLARWQSEHASTHDPFAIVSGVEEVRSHLLIRDSLSVGAGDWVYFARAP